MFSKIKEIKYFAKGKRSRVYTGILNNKKIIIKFESRNLGRIKNEAFWLKKLNKKNIGPKLISFGDNYFICEFISGKRILDFLKNSSKKDKIFVVKEVLKQCRILDKLKVNKFELTNPYKHILIDKNLKVKMIDFERCRKVVKAKNVTQFGQFIISKVNLSINKEEFKKNLKEYKNYQTDENFRKILKLVK